MKKTIFMEKEKFEKWIAALRSGGYKQGEGCLRDEEGFCCLGVLQDCLTARVESSQMPSMGWLKDNGIVFLGRYGNPDVDLIEPGRPTVVLRTAGKEVELPQHTATYTFDKIDREKLTVALKWVTSNMDYQNLERYCHVKSLSFILAISKSTITKARKDYPPFGRAYEQWQNKRDTLFMMKINSYPPACWIFLAKNWLGMTDQKDINVTGNGYETLMEKIRAKQVSRNSPVVIKQLSSHLD